MNVAFVTPRLSKLADHAGARLVLFTFEERHPLAGITGAVDWRLHGHLSRLVIRGFLTGKAGEKLLVPLDDRLAPSHLVVLGLGPRDALDAARTEGALRRMFDAARALGEAELVVALPGRPEQLVDPVEAISLFLAVYGALERPPKVAIVEAAAAQKAMLAVLERHRLKRSMPTT
ncbi:MAG: hypothetical protein M0R80_12350 [Proteobacteria bacterium]|nr:hypothetical protein [Pseudomonadota bacterium]